LLYRSERRANENNTEFVLKIIICYYVFNCNFYGRHYLPIKDRRSREYHEIQEKVSAEVFGEFQTPVMEPLFRAGKREYLPEAPRLLETDFRMIKWLYDLTSAPGKVLLEMICERKLFKRILVISERKNADLWEKMADLRKNFDWQAIKLFQKTVQEELIGIIDSLEEQKRTTSVLEKSKTDEIVSRNLKNEILFLVDIPTERKGSSIDLYYLAESRIFGPVKSTEESVLMEDSVLWTDLSKNFHKSVGKIRLFCHPDIVETCTAGLNRSDIEGALKTGYRFATK
jgi:hypothetical protein